MSFNIHGCDSLQLSSSKRTREELPCENKANMRLLIHQQRGFQLSLLNVTLSLSGYDTGDMIWRVVRQNNRFVLLCLCAWSLSRRESPRDLSFAQIQVLWTKALRSSRNVGNCIRHRVPCHTTYTFNWKNRVNVTTLAHSDNLQHPSRPVLGPTQPHMQWVPGHSPGVRPLLG